jgi:hypothetical protein
MPAMPRTLSKSTKVAYKIMGIPANIAHKRTKSEKVVNKRLMFEETFRVR